MQTGEWLTETHNPDDLDEIEYLRDLVRELEEYTHRESRYD